MTENKRYNIKPSKIIEDGFCIQDDRREHSFPTVDDKSTLVMYEKALNEQDKKIKELNKYCTACDDTLLAIQEFTYKLLTIDFKDIEMSFIHDCIKSINKCDLLEMEKLKREYGDVD